MSAIIEVENLEKKYGNFTAVDKISFTVESGETFGILGPNGAGKTTTLEMIEGLKRPTGGKIILNGKDVLRDSNSVKSDIGVQLQASTFFEGLNLRELVEVFASLYNQNVNPMELLDEVQLAEKSENQVKELSGGQKQRLSIAIALVNDPKVLFLDEPTTGLDPQARRNLWDLVEKIKARGKTIVLTTHYMDEAEVLCDRIAVMDHAKIITLNTTAKLLSESGVNPKIQFKSRANLPEERLRKIRGVIGFHKNEDGYVLETTNSQETLENIFAGGEDKSLGIEELTVKRPTLEDVFLKLTGHDLRE